MSSFLLLALAGCSAGPYGAPYGSTVALSGMSSSSLVYDTAFMEPADGLGSLLKMSAFVVIPSSSWAGSLPGNGIKVEVTSGWSGAYLVPQGAVLLVDDYETECNESGGVDDPENPCSVWFDDQNQQYIEFSGEFAEVGEFQPTYLAGATDGRGFLDFYVFLDSVPVDADGTPIDFSVYASIGVADAVDTFSF